MLVNTTGISKLMDLPARYPYNPSRKMVAVTWAASAFGLAIAVLVRAL
jgi:hypothetical protein